MVYHKILKLLAETLDYFQSGLFTNPTKEIRPQPTLKNCAKFKKSIIRQLNYRIYVDNLNKFTISLFLVSFPHKECNFLFKYTIDISV